MSKKDVDGPPIIIRKADTIVPERADYASTHTMYEGLKRNSGLAIASMCAGIVGLCLCWIPVLGIILGIIGMVFGGIGIAQTGKPGVGGRGMAIAGLVTGLIALVFWPIMLLVGFSLFSWWLW